MKMNEPVRQKFKGQLLLRLPVLLRTGWVFSFVFVSLFVLFVCLFLTRQDHLCTKRW